MDVYFSVEWPLLPAGRSNRDYMNCSQTPCSVLCADCNTHLNPWHLSLIGAFLLPYFELDNIPAGPLLLSWCKSAWWSGGSLSAALMSQLRLQVRLQGRVGWHAVTLPSTTLSRTVTRISLSLLFPLESISYWSSHKLISLSVGKL